MLSLAQQRLRPWRGVVGGLWVVQVDQDAWVGGGVSAREGHLLGIGSPRASSNRDLRAREVELGATNAAGAVQGDVLRPEQIIAVLDAGGDGNVDGLQAYMSSGVVLADICLPKQRMHTETCPQKAM